MGRSLIFSSTQWDQGWEGGRGNEIELPSGKKIYGAVSAYGSFLLMEKRMRPGSVDI